MNNPLFRSMHGPEVLLGGGGCVKPIKPNQTKNLWS